jgi:hypothetical protein
MTIEEIHSTLRNSQMTPYIDVQEVIDSIIKIRSDAYNEGWQDCQDENE